MVAATDEAQSPRFGNAPRFDYSVPRMAVGFVNARQWLLMSLTCNEV
ncbi:hypothetical protein H6G97_50300 [Nostoc flagelliforme FACHB-838]|uniref:Uncharacterized protein n=1 Tax=Nostoc flagelliforme FACHB-838 TaxID=2692904 RepID=A0ABR8E8Y2_9NOSO|nr:hypothetical protein [Nostoc flagelliforme]MBD2536970.1 hypothetical protein [Nostoc flagelliforme FACHB-838]